jgi:hypothetical protein
LVLTVLVAFVAESGVVVAQNQLTTYVDPPAGQASFADFAAQVSTPGGSYSNLFCYLARMYKQGADDLDHGVSNQLTGFVMFDCAGSVQLRITYNAGALTSAKVWPLAYGITPTISGNVITFSMTGPKNVVLEVNDNMYEALSIFANPMETNVPSSSDPNVMFFGPGVYQYGSDSRITRLTVKTHEGSGTCTEDVITVPTGTTVYLQGGAVVKAQIRTNPFWNESNWTTNQVSKNNITIRGRGVVDCSQWCGNFTNADKSSEPELPGIVLFNANNTKVEGVVVLNPERQQVHLMGSNHCSIDNVKGFTSLLEGDGIVCTGSDSYDTIKNCFIRCADDAHVCDGNNNNIIWDNNVLFPMRTHAFILGVGGGNISNYIARNCYVECFIQFPTYRGVFGIYGCSGTLQNLTFQNIKIERTNVGGMLEIYPYSYWNSCGANIKTIEFNHIYYSSNPTNDYWSPISGTGSSNTVNGINFDSCYFDGNLVTDSYSGHLAIGSYVSNVKFNGVASANPSGYWLTPSPSVIPPRIVNGNGYYKIQSRSQSNYCIYDNGSGTAQLENGSADQYLWGVESDSGYFRFRNRSTGTYLNVQANNGVVHTGAAAGWSADWFPVATDTAYFQLRNRLYALQNILIQNNTVASVVTAANAGIIGPDQWKLVEQTGGIPNGIKEHSFYGMGKRQPAINVVTSGNGGTIVRYDCGYAAHGQLRLFTTTGRIVRSEFVSGAGTLKLTKNTLGKGVYIYQFVVDGQTGPSVSTASKCLRTMVVVTIR